MLGMVAMEPDLGGQEKEAYLHGIDAQFNVAMEPDLGGQEKMPESAVSGRCFPGRNGA